ncbi:hypothetical protein ElyMa_005924400 [Elysia marginata]|uniref:Uncharacterized protein n=1 Tax=Elysia marginata TaxID=1093978 RepID=A0AAV4G6L6_9GAST|nr:hypothetical protein ElyMa_005924400 [Elysia marginata]
MIGLDGNGLQYFIPGMYLIDTSEILRLNAFFCERFQFDTDSLEIGEHMAQCRFTHGVTSSGKTKPCFHRVSGLLRNLSCCNPSLRLAVLACQFSVLPERK